MTNIKVWKDEEGYALEFEDTRIELTADGLNEFVSQLCKLQITDVDDGETLSIEFCIDMEEDGE